MKKICLTHWFLIPIMIFCQGLFSQGRKSLDNEFGIKKFKLESNIKLYANDIKYDWIDTKGTEFYYYSKNDIKLLFGKNVKIINLAFVDNKLYSIDISFGVLNPIELKELTDLLTSKYDIPVTFLYPDENLNFVAKWETGKVYMQLDEYSNNDPVFKNETHIFINSKALKKILEFKQ